MSRQELGYLAIEKARVEIDRDITNAEFSFKLGGEISGQTGNSTSTPTKNEGSFPQLVSPFSQVGNSLSVDVTIEPNCSRDSKEVPQSGPLVSFWHPSF